ncbi:ribonuclease HII [uncultured Croceitalea sp.]|uniref:ribonuclease HII n=1 Tax=uncultured Croceitalea sp. TaxID=1798908 RepID=UPI0033058411
MKLRILFLFVLITACNQQKVTIDSDLNFLPQNPSAVFKINNLSNFKSELKNTTILNKVKKSDLYKSITERVNAIEYLNPDASCILAFYEQGKSNFEFLFLANKSEDLFQLENISQKSVETMTYENRTMKKIVLETSELFSYDIENKVLVSTSKMLLENAIRAGSANSHPESLEKLYGTSDPAKPASVFINLEDGANLIDSHFKAASKITSKNFSDWVALDINTSQNQLLLSGVAIANDSLKNFINIFKDTSPLNDRTAFIAPKGSDAILTYTFDNHEAFSRNQKKYLDRATPLDTIFNTVEEIGILYLNNSKAIALHSFGTESLTETITSFKTKSFEYQGSELLQLNKADLITSNFSPLVVDFSSNYCTIIENSFVFAENREVLQNIIANNKSGTTFNTSNYYQVAKSSLANEASVFFIANKKGIDHFLENEFSNGLFSDFKKLDFADHTFAAQFVADEGFFHTNLLVTHAKPQVSSKGVSPLFTLELDTDLATDPQFVKNHRTGKHEIVVQDKDNFLYLISTDGKVLWKKQLESQVRGNIQQVDLYKNGKLQLAFCTSNQFLIIDRNGKEVAPFNKRFEGGNLNPLAVFDYENSRNYRFVVTQGRKIFMYDGSANIVDGFTYTEAKSAITKAPKHFRVAKKDYLAFTLEDNTMTIRHRAGQERIKVKEKIEFSGNEIFLYKNKFSITDNKGVLHQVDTKGKLTKTNFNLNQDHGMFATSKTLALMNENTLSIKGKKVELELGVYTRPKIFYIYDKIYVSVTDIQNQKIYLFDSQAEAINNFPVYGSSLIDVMDIDGDKKLELVAKDQENSLIVYKIF